MTTIRKQDPPADDSGIKVGDRVDNGIRRGSNGGYMFTNSPDIPACAGFCTPVAGVQLCPRCAEADAVEAAQEADIARREQADAEVYGGGWVL